MAKQRVSIQVDFEFDPPEDSGKIPDNLGLWNAFSAQFADSLLSAFNEWVEKNHPGAEESYGIRGSCTGILGDAIQKRFQEEANWYYNLEEQ